MYNHYNKIVNDSIPWTTDTANEMFDRLSTRKSLSNLMKFSKFDIVDDKTLEIHTEHTVRHPNKKDTSVYKFTNILQISKNIDTIGYIYNCKILSTSTNTNNSRTNTDESSITKLHIHWLYEFIENTASNQYQEAYADNISDPPNYGM